MNNPSSMGIKAIRQELESMGIGTKSFIEKSEFVNALLDARNERNDISGDNMKVKSGTCSVGINIEMKIMTMHLPTAAPSAARREASVSRRARRVCLSSIVMLIVKTNIGRNIKFHVKNEPPSYAMRRCLRTHHRKRTVPSASYHCRQN